MKIDKALAEDAIKRLSQGPVVPYIDTVSEKEKKAIRLLSERRTKSFDVGGAPAWEIKKITGHTFNHDGKLEYLVEWGSTFEPPSNILDKKFIKTYESERRQLVRKAYIDDEAVESP